MRKEDTRSYGHAEAARPRIRTFVHKSAQQELRTYGHAGEARPRIRTQNCRGHEVDDAGASRSRKTWRVIPTAETEYIRTCGHAEAARPRVHKSAEDTNRSSWLARPRSVFRLRNPNIRKKYTSEHVATLRPPVRGYVRTQKCRKKKPTYGQAEANRPRMSTQNCRRREAVRQEQPDRGAHGVT